MEEGLLKLKKAELQHVELQLIKPVRTKSGLYLPKIMFSGHELYELGFMANTLVRIACCGDELTFTACGTGLVAYQQEVGEARKNKELIAYVQAHKSYAGQLTLILESNWLKRNGFLTFDVLMMTKEAGCMKARRLPLDVLPIGGVRRLYTVVANRKKSGKLLPSLRIQGTFLAELQFTLGQLLALTSTTDQLSLTVDPQATTAKKVYGQAPTHTRVKQYKGAGNPSLIDLSGFWLYDLGFKPHDKVIVDCTPSLITIKRLDLSKLHV